VELRWLVTSLRHHELLEAEISSRRTICAQKTTENSPDIVSIKLKPLVDFSYLFLGGSASFVCLLTFSMSYSHLCLSDMIAFQPPHGNPRI